MLVRMEPGGGRPIAAGRFVGARLYGDVEFFAERLSVGPPGIHDAAREVWPSWRPPPPLLKKNRKKQCNVEWDTGLKELADQS